MKQALSEEQSPLDACLESVLPGVHQWHHANQAAVALLGNDMRSMHNNMKVGFSHVIEELKETRRQRLIQEKSFVMLLDMGRRVLLTGESIEVDASLLSPSRFLTQDTADRTAFGTHHLRSVDESALQTSFAALQTSDKQSDKQSAIEKLKTYTMKPKHGSFVDLLSEWIGIGDFQDDFGGIEGCNNLFGSSWRKHLSTYTYSRTERTIKCIRELATQNGIGEFDACRQLQDVYEQQRCSVKNMVDYFTTNGFLNKRKPRGKISKATIVSPSQDETTLMQ
jgi:hypothetical protein